MGDQTAISWTEHTFNPWMGCFKVSQGCKNCYADALTSGRMGLNVFGADTSLRRRTGKGVWSRPAKWNREAEKAGAPAPTFCASLADVFEDAPGPNEWRDDVWALVRATPWLDWQLLTKRPENIARMLPDDWYDGPGGCYPNVWLGTSIEDNRVADRACELVRVPAHVHFISYEPAIGPIDQVDLDGIDWVIAGGESGPGWRAMDLEWALEARARCAEHGIAFFFKQHAGPRSGSGADALGEIVHEYPPTWDRGRVHA